jgi:uncharacterized membrane protein (Fun14 family)
LAEKPRILKAVSEMIAQGYTDDQIVENLRSVGLSDDQIKKVMQAAQKEGYPQFKREMGSFVEEKLKSNRSLIDQMVRESLEKRKEEIKKELGSETQEIVGDLAKQVNEKTRDMEMAVKKVREENLKLKEEEELNRSDIDLLIAGPAKIRMALSIVFLVVGLIVLGFAIFYLAPLALSQINGEQLDTAALTVIETAVAVAGALGTMTVGIFFAGKPGRQ